MAYRSVVEMAGNPTVNTEDPWLAINFIIKV